MDSLHGPVEPDRLSHGKGLVVRANASAVARPVVLAGPRPVGILIVSCGLVVMLGVMGMIVDVLGVIMR
ncbi:MAG: hypothetical protein ACE10B_01030 [Phycisphaerales bacterium]|nr:hypothetical protein [Planctomycetota bacterium]